MELSSNNQIKQWILVTGANTGIGRAIAEYFSKNNFGVYASVRKEEDMVELAKITNIVPIKFDVRKIDEIKNAFEIIKERKTGLNGLVNNAGIAVAGPLMDISVEEFQEQLDINIVGIHRVTKTFFPLLYESKGTIIMISSDSGFFATPFFGPYCTSKFAVEGYSDSLRRELMLFGMKVIIIEPGRITTPIWKKGEVFLNKYPNSLWFKEAKTIGEYAIEKGQKAGLDPIEVAKLVYKAFNSKNPKTRYLIAPNTFKYKIMKKLPDKRIDKMILKELK